MSTCIIGDIHGCCDTLVELLPLVEQRASSFIFLGDYIDRGPNSKGVIDCIFEFQKQHPQTITLMGNHERMLLDYLKGYDTYAFLNVGGKETLESYGINPDTAPEKVAEQLPPEHLDFFENLPLLWEDRYGIYVHAGIEPRVPLHQQMSGCCLWVRDEFIRSQHNFGKPIVFGHTMFKKPLVQRNKIGIDTGAVYGGSLTAVLLPEQEFISVPVKELSYIPEVPADVEGLIQEKTFGFGLGKLLRLFR